ncbi:MAG: prefoldin subunit alpha [Candidatus Thermoplasmatota archaeon]|jgi:prefoldin alpha subunit|nr:prefoldin subunit alpha [Candidatus Thermoplasmatota archaeon]
MTDQMDMGQELELGMAQLEHLKGQMENLRAQAQSVQAVIMDHQRSIDVLNDLTTRNERSVLVPLGASVLMKANIDAGGSCILDHGAGLMITTSNEEAVKKLTSSMGSLRQTLQSMEKAMQDLLGRYEELSARTQELYGMRTQQGDGPEGTF